MNRGRRVVTTALVAALLVLVCPVAARAAAWPVGPPRPAVVRGWEPPPSPYGRGHRGADLAAPPGTEVRAAAPGRVSFAGPVAGRGVLSIELADTGDPPLRTTYEPVRPLVAPGALVSEGEVVAVVAEGSAHCPRGCLHWGLRRGAEYLDPLSLLPASALRRGPSRLLPVFGVPRPAAAPEVSARRLADATASPSRAGADAVQALILATAAVLSRRALRPRREGALRRSGRRWAVCGGARRGAAAPMGRRWGRTRAPADPARQSRARPGPGAGRGRAARASGARLGARAVPTRQSQAQGGGAGARGRRRNRTWGRGRVASGGDGQGRPARLGRARADPGGARGGAGQSLTLHIRAAWRIPAPHGRPRLRTGEAACHARSGRGSWAQARGVGEEGWPVSVSG